jgi:ATP-dependent DNA helicase RecG
VTPQTLQQWLDAGETQTQEFKTSFDKSSIETLVGFANAKGGRVLVGVTDQGTLLGTTLGKESLNEWLVQIKAATSPSIIPEIEAYSFNGKTMVVISVAEFPVKPVSSKGRYYKRVSNTNQALNASEISDLYMQSLQLSWDSYPAHNAQLQDLSMDKVEQFVKQVNGGGRFALGTTDSLTALNKLNYINQGHPTWAAMLLFAKEPLRHNIHIGRFKTPSLIIDDRQITDTLFEAVDQAMRFILSYVPVAFEITGAVHRKERFAYPLPALREALLNAVVHRDYKDGSDIQVKIFDNSISIFSPGRLYDGLTLAELQQDHYRSRLRNKLVAEAFYLTTGIEKYGSGFIRMRKALADYPEVQLLVEEISGGISITFTKTHDEVSEGLSEGVSEGLNEGVNALKERIVQNPGLRANALAESLQTSVKNVERWLKQLKDQGLIEFRGAPKTGGYHPSSFDDTKASA